MRKTLFAKKIFIFLVLFFLSVPAFILFGTNDFWKLYAPEADREKPESLFKGYERGEFQKSFESWFARYFVGRNFLIRFRNTSYFLGNFRYFVFMNENLYITMLKGKVVYPMYLLGNDPGQELFDKMYFIQKEMEKRGKKFLFVMAPNTARLSFNNQLQFPYQKYFRLFSKLEIDTYKESRIYLDKIGINYFDAQEYFESLIEKGDLNTVSPYDAHWTRYGAGLAVVKSLNVLKTKYRTNWNIPKIISVSFSTTTSNDRDALDRMNIFNTFNFEHNEFPISIYEKLSKNNTNRLNFVVLGDSFGIDYSNELIESKIASEENIFIHLWSAPNNTEKIISADVIILIFTEYNMYRELSKQIVDYLYNYFKTLQSDISKTNP
ncbi:MAG: hypothetical protein LBQ37_03120 [Elusimicrobiota bacterium]|jgi:hypothetical protein|nr:hypothetical protein [Elusimicrobiota bacterium]